MALLFLMMEYFFLSFLNSFACRGFVLTQQENWIILKSLSIVFVDLAEAQCANMKYKYFDIFSSRTGLNFLSEMRGLPPMCFLGTDVTLWIIHNIHSVKSRGEAVQLGQVRRISSAPDHVISASR